MFEGLRKGVINVIEKFSKTELTAEKLESILWDCELLLIENDVAFLVAEELCKKVKEELEGKKIARFEDKKKIIEDILRENILRILKTEKKIDLFNLLREKKKLKQPFIIVFVGINGTGKTTTISKIAKLLLDKGFSVILSCSDTYRTGSIEQLEGHAKRLGIKVIKHNYGADPAAVAFDAISHAKAHSIDTVLIDTAGRMQTNMNLMKEMQKIVRVTKPDLVIFIGDSLTGNDAIDQAREFSEYVGIDASILSKADADAKGGAVLSISYITKKPTIYLGIGQSYGDLVTFEPEIFVKKFFSDI